MTRERTRTETPLRLACLLACFLMPALTTGCLFAGGAKRIEVDEATRIHVKFSGADAARDFHEAFSRSDAEPFTAMSGYVVPFLVARGEGVYHETLHYNAAVRLADIDRDGSITAQEARNYVDYIDRAEED